MFNYYYSRTNSSDQCLPTFIVRKPLSLPLFGFQVRADVIFSQSGDGCPIFCCPVIPDPQYSTILTQRGANVTM